MSQKTTYLAFKDENGTVVSVAKKVEVTDDNTSLRLFLHPPDQAEAVKISEQEYNAYSENLTSTDR